MNASANAMLLEGQEALAADRKRIRENRVALFESTMEMITKSLTAAGSDMVSFLGMSEPEWEVRANKINIVWCIEPWFRILAQRAIATGVPADSFTIVGHLGVSGAEPVFSMQSTFKREQIMMTIARYLEECTSMTAEK